MNFMQSPLRNSARRRVIPSYRDLYDEMLNSKPSDSVAQFLRAQLECARGLAHDLPMDLEDLAGWAERNVIAVGVEYREYLRARQDGKPRRYFSNKSHALHFLKNVAPTKLVDGSWLYGAVQCWNEPRFQDVIRIYLEELGDGIASKNHVVIFKRLLAENHCEWHSLSASNELNDDVFQQGAIQLALAHRGREFLPELIGFNLGYEQLPLHLLITAYELQELGIDPYYFTLHITIDNLDSGHARRALHAVETLRPRDMSVREFNRRVIDGYRLNSLGKSTTEIIESFDIDAEMVNLFRQKATIGQYMHSDRCKIGGRAINEWLSAPEKIPGLLGELEKSGWIRRNHDPAQSRFWQLLQGERPPMFGVFTPFEQQLIFDWIAGDGYTGLRQNSMNKPDIANAIADSCEDHSGIIDIDDYRLTQRLANSRSMDARMNELIRLMGPASHSTPSGLHATRLFKQLYDIHAYNF